MLDGTAWKLNWVPMVQCHLRESGSPRCTRHLNGSAQWTLFGNQCCELFIASRTEQSNAWPRRETCYIVIPSQPAEVANPLSRAACASLSISSPDSYLSRFKGRRICRSTTLLTIVATVFRPPARRYRVART
jgi:hypothetical protein